MKKGEHAPEGYQRIPYHIVFAVKFDLCCKARLVAGSNCTDLGKEDIYSGVVGIESVRTGSLLGEPNKLTCCAGDIDNAFVYGTTKEKVYLLAGPEFGPESEGIVLLVARSLYGLCTSAEKFHETLGDSLKQLGYKPSHYDHDLWYIDKGTHYEYLASYVDNVLVWSKDPMAVMKALKKSYILKGVGVPEYFLGGDVD